MLTISVFLLRRKFDQKKKKKKKIFTILFLIESSFSSLNTSNVFELIEVFWFSLNFSSRDREHSSKHLKMNFSNKNEENFVFLRNDFEVQERWNALKQIVFHLTIEHFDDNHQHEDIWRLFWLILHEKSNICTLNRDIALRPFPTFELQPTNPFEEEKNPIKIRWICWCSSYFLNTNTKIVSIFNFWDHQLNPKFDDRDLIDRKTKPNENSNQKKEAKNDEHYRENEKYRVLIYLLRCWSTDSMAQHHWKHKSSFHRPKQMNSFLLILFYVFLSLCWSNGSLMMNDVCPADR